MAFTAALACLGGMAQLPWLCTPMKPTEKLKVKLRTSKWVLPADVARVGLLRSAAFQLKRPLIATLPPIGRDGAAAPPLAPTPPRALTSAAFGAGGGFVQRAVGSGRLGAADG